MDYSWFYITCGFRKGSCRTAVQLMIAIIATSKYTYRNDMSFARKNEEQNVSQSVVIYS